MMKTGYVFLTALALAAAVTGCAATNAGTDQTPTDAPAAAQVTEAVTVPAETAPGEAQTEPEAPAVPATGSLIFHVGEAKLSAGAPVQALADAGVYFDDDMRQILEPGHFSPLLRCTYDGGRERLYLYFVAMNMGQDPLPLSDCRIYSLSTSIQNGLTFTVGDDVTVTTGTTTDEELISLLGEPTERYPGWKYEDFWYYDPFDCVNFQFHFHKLESITAYYAADVFGDLAADFAGDLSGVSVKERDCYLLLSQYMDVAPNLGEKLDAKIPIGESLLIGGQEVTLGTRGRELPQPMRDAYAPLRCKLAKGAYMNAGRPGYPQITFINLTGEFGIFFGPCTVKSVWAHNPGYTSWNYDFSRDPDFDYQGITNESTIEDVVTLLGQPCEIICTATGRSCFAWLHYESEERGTLRIKVDPVSDEIIELRLNKYFRNERSYE